jgi:hypothetical protein
MKKFSLFLAVFCIGLTVLLAASPRLPAAARPAAAPPAPVLQLPANGGTAVTPTFQWQAAAGASYYEIQAASDNVFSTVIFQQKTYQRTITPVRTLPNGVLYWRVRAYDSSDAAGDWSGAWSFTRQITAPALTSPANAAAAVIWPNFQWQKVDGAAYYHIQVATDNTFTTIVFEDDLYNLSVTPVSSLDNTAFYWHVQGMDAGGNGGEWSVTWTFTKVIPAPSLVSPANGAGAVVTPTFQWQAAQGAVYYEVEGADNPDFLNPWSEQTYDLSFTPIDTLDNGRLYWHVRGWDNGSMNATNDHEGAFSATWSFTKTIPAPALTGPADNATVTGDPQFTWQAAAGAASYRVEIASDQDFNSVVLDQNTYNLSFTPIDTNNLVGVRYWRVRGVDADGHEGTVSAARQVTLNAAPTCSNSSQALAGPADGSTVNFDPAFQWDCQKDATRYKLLIYKKNGANWDQSFYLYSEYTTYTPFNSGNQAGDHHTLLDGEYRWYVEAYAGSTLKATSSIWYFTKTTQFSLLTPTDGQTVSGTDPTFTWQGVRCAESYRIRIYRNGDEVYSLITKYLRYLPYNDASMGSDVETIPSGSYVWEVEARDGSNRVMVTSQGFAFSKTLPMTLNAPAPASNHAVDPRFSWLPVSGANKYNLWIYPLGQSTDYAHLSTDYPYYTPYNSSSFATDKPVLPNGSYSWKVEAVQGSTAVTTSVPISFTRNASLNLVSPAGGAEFPTGGAPTFQWQAVQGAEEYRLVIRRGASSFVTVSTPYLLYTPYDDTSIGTDGSVFPDGTDYTWYVEAWNGGARLATSASRGFSIGSPPGLEIKIYVPFIRHQ